MVDQLGEQLASQEAFLETRRTQAREQVEIVVLSALSYTGSLYAKAHCRTEGDCLLFFPDRLL